MTLIKLYTYEESQEIWNNLANEIHPFNYEERSKEDLLKCVYDLEEYAYKLKNERNYYKREGNKALLYKKRAHVYKVELGKCRRKLTRIYRVFNDIQVETVTKLIDKCDYKVLVWLLEFIEKIKVLLKAI